MTSRRTKISPKTGRGLGHVTHTIFGSTVGYPSDSLASCNKHLIIFTSSSSDRTSLDTSHVHLFSSYQENAFTDLFKASSWIAYKINEIILDSSWLTIIPQKLTIETMPSITHDTVLTVSWQCQVSYYHWLSWQCHSVIKSHCGMPTNWLW